MKVYDLPTYIFARTSENMATSTIKELTGHGNEYFRSWRNFCNSTKLLNKVKRH
jgi:hypothetical protein